MEKFLYPCTLALTLALASCAVGPNYEVTIPTSPDYWNTNLQTDLKKGTPNIEGWWRKFHDPTLNKLIAIAKEENKDLKIAAERVLEAQAQFGVAYASLAPGVAGSGLYDYSRSSESMSFSNPNPSDTYGLGLDASWEVDFFGGLRRSIESAGASVQATDELYHDTMVLLYSDVATRYVEYRTLQKRIKLAEDNIVSQGQSVEITKDRKAAGLAPQTDVSQAQTNLATSKALIPQLKLQLASTRNQLAFLLGRYPGSIESILGNSTNIPKPPANMRVGLPADMLRARPDVRAAERQLAAQTAQVGVATAELYPKFYINGTLGLGSQSSADLFDSNSRIYSLGPSFQWRLFEGGRIRQDIKVEESRTRQALLNYEKTVLNAVTEVETALSNINHEYNRRSHLNTSVVAARETVSLIKENYKEGIVDFQNVLDAERTIFGQEDAAASSEGIYTAYHIQLYRSLGGGTKMRPVSQNPAK
ncbi:efflux transporter outer membrane subunit [Rubritalea spongiae]|uniref:Efflux transporter outer membrane subunit n=1 Tax=Rubritalea spongiae TaxID=430797 RepID=A0ABW5E428_9BACT